MTKPRVKILRGLPSEFFEQATSIYASSLHAKLVPLMGDVDRVVRVLAPALQPDRCVSAMVGGQLAGLAGFWLDGRGLFEPPWRQFRTEYGPLRGTLRMLALAVLERSKDKTSLLMDGIAVDPGFRSMGLGSRLLEEIKQTARDHGKQRVRLDVIDTNPRAQALYERHGFVAGQPHSISWLRFVFSFRTITAMTCELPLQTQSGN